MSQGLFVFIVNPQSRNGTTRRTFDRVRSHFERAFPQFEVRFTEQKGHATQLTREAIARGARAVIAVGGDGTNNEVVNGLFDGSGQLLSRDTAFGVVTSGTGGDFRRTFGWSTEPLEDLARLARAEVRHVDIGYATTTRADGSTQGRYFTNIASVGVSADVVDVVNASSKALGARLSFLVGSARAMMGFSPVPVSYAIDGGEAVRLDATFVAVANGQYFGGGMHVAPHARVDDGQFDCVAIAGGGLPFFVRHGPSLYSGKHVGLPQVSVAQGKTVEVKPTGARVVKVEVDGEAFGQLPARFELRAAVLPMLV